MAQSLGYASLLRLNTTILLRLAMRSAILIAIRSSVISVGHRLGRWTGLQASRRMDRVSQISERGKV